MTTDDGSSLAQAKVHEGVMDEVVKSDSDLLSASFNEGPGRWLTEWNFPGAAPPKAAWPSRCPKASPLASPTTSTRAAGRLTKA
jgi:hypothetical protein